jgi:hypothetical protein
MPGVEEGRRTIRASAVGLASCVPVLNNGMSVVSMHLSGSPELGSYSSLVKMNCNSVALSRTSGGTGLRPRARHRVQRAYKEQRHGIEMR